MNTLRHLLQTADPLRHERPPDLEDVRTGIVAMRMSPSSEAVQPRCPKARPMALAVLCASLALAWPWYGSRLPGMPTLGAQVRFEIRLAEDHPIPGLQVAEVGNTGPLVYLHPEMLAGNDDVADAWVVDANPGFDVGVQMRPEAADRMRQATRGHVGRPVAILIDGRVAMAPIVRSPIGDSAVITGHFTRDDADRIAHGLVSH
jgi:hypothetical protein